MKPESKAVHWGDRQAKTGNFIPATTRLSRRSV